MKKLEEKYAELLLKRCLNFNQSKSLMIHCELKEHIRFAELVASKAREMGIEDIYINLNDYDEVHNYLANTPTEEIGINEITDRSAWETYAKKGGALLFFNTSVPGIMDDIPAEKNQKLLKERLKTLTYYKANVTKYIFPWCIACLPNERWAKSLFPNDENAYEKLYLYIMKMCMIDTPDPVKSWENFIDENNYYKNKLNSLDIKSLHFKNSLGTDIKIGIPAGNMWQNLDKADSTGGQMIANMPSYEIFTTPHRMQVDGIVYSSRPLYYLGCCIDKFSITFKDGKVTACQAETGQEMLEKMIFEEENMDRLGEIALVPNDSPISNTGLVFKTTLYDENASCHMALGHGSAKHFKDSDNLSEEELIKRGLNLTQNHVDFMFGTEDLEIVAETNEGPKLIFKNGNFNI